MIVRMRDRVHYVYVRSRMVVLTNLDALYVEVLGG